MRRSYSLSLTVIHVPYSRAVLFGACVLLYFIISTFVLIFGVSNLINRRDKGDIKWCANVLYHFVLRKR